MNLTARLYPEESRKTLPFTTMSPIEPIRADPTPVGAIQPAAPTFASPVSETSATPTPEPGKGPTTFHDMTKAAIEKLTAVNILYVLGLIATAGPAYVGMLPEVQISGHSLQWYGLGIIATAAAIEKVLRFWWSAKDAGLAPSNASPQ